MGICYHVLACRTRRTCLRRPLSDGTQRIAAEEAARDRAKPDMAPDFVSGAQERLQRASEEHYRTFSFKA